MKKRKNVLLALGWYDHRLLQGIGAYAAEHHWHLSSASVTQEFVIPYEWRGDGILAWLAGEDELANFVLSQKIPVVDFSLRRKHPRPRVVLDHDMTGRMAAQHFIGRGFRNFLYYSFSDNWTYQARGASFVQELERVGFACKWLKGHDLKATHRDRSFWLARQKWLEAEIIAAPKPVAIFTANGAHALEVLEACESAGARIPDDVAIIGWEDDLLVGQGNLRSITTIDPNYEELGYQGAALLESLMAGDRPPSKPIQVNSARIITRHSTEVTSVTHPGIQRALRFITEHLAQPFSVDDVAEAAGMSRRGLHQAFLDHMGRTPGSHIRNVRLDLARKLLAETDTKVETVAKRSGYPSLNTFFVAFKKVAGKTPAEYRREARRGRLTVNDE
ncbi:MAG: substrate-binding domain-containing protein [Pirellulales bacterium]